MSNDRRRWIEGIVFLVAFDLTEGGALCRSCRRGVSISPEALALLRRILGGDLGRVLGEGESPASHEVAVLATTIDCASIILPITPPELFAAAISTGLSPSCNAVIFCRLPNSTFDDVSDPVNATPSQPSIVPKKG